MLTSWKTAPTLNGISVTAIATTDCPQGGLLALFPLLWPVVVDELLNILTSHGFEVQGYANELVIIRRDNGADSDMIV